MSSELIYTSVPNGLKPGSKGYCTVALTAGLSASWIERLEPLSGYKAVYPLGDPNSNRNPINFSHWRVAVAGKSKSVLSRIAFAGADYSGRSNMLAHHVVVDPQEQAAGGPAWMLRQPHVMRTQWDTLPQQFPKGPALPAGDRAPAICAAWAKALGDAGWAGRLAESFVTDPARPVYLICPPGTDVLSLFEESLSLLPPSQRWAVTFSTFFTKLPLNLTCAWRAVIANTPAAAEALRLGPRAVVIDLTNPPTAPPTGAYAEAARAGTGPVGAVATAPPRVTTPAVTSPSETPSDTDMADSAVQKEAALKINKPRSGKRLAPAGAGNFDADIPMGVLVEEEEDFQSPRYIIANHGVRRWVFTASIIGCLLLGAAGSGTTYFLLRGQLRKAKDTKVLAQQKIKEAEKSIADAKAQCDDAKAQAEFASSRALSANNDTSKAQGRVNELEKLKDEEIQKAKGLQDDKDQLVTSVQGLNGENARLLASNKDLNTEIARLKEELATKNGGAANSGGSDGDGQASANASPFNDMTAKLSFPQPTDGSSPHFDIPLPAVASSAIAISLVWPNGQDTFDVTADNQKKYHLTERTDGHDTFVQTSLPGGTGMVTKDIFRMEISEGKLVVASLIKSDPNTVANAATIAAQAALENTAFLVSTKGGDKVWRLSLNRRENPREVNKSKNVFDKPSLPAGISVEQVRVDGGTREWQVAPGSGRGVFTSKMDKGTAEFTVTLSAPFEKEWQASVDLTAFNRLKDQRDKANAEKTEAETAATRADDALKKKQDSHASGDTIREFMEKKTEAEQTKQLKQAEASRLDNLVNDWRNKYESLSHSFPLSLRIPNGVEIMRVEIGLPPLPQ